MIKDGVNDLLNKLNAQIDTEGLAQYLLYLKAEDVIVCPDLVVIDIINNKLVELDNLEFMTMLFEIQGIFASKLNKFIDIELNNNKIIIVPKIKDIANSVDKYYLTVKPKGFMLRNIYNKYLKNKFDKNKLMKYIIINPNIASFLTSDCNIIIYDDTIDFMRFIIQSVTEKGHMSKVITETNLIKHITDNFHERETVMDFISFDIEFVLIDILTKLNELEHTFNPEKLVNLKISSIIGQSNYNNIKLLETNKFKFSVGLLDLYKKNIINS